MALVLIVAFEVSFFFSLGTLIHDAGMVFSTGMAIPIFVEFTLLTWIFYAFHELAHGLACKRFCGSVQEMGILWRYLSLFPYCKIDDIVLCHNRWHRVYVAFAGSFMSLLMLLPVALLWWFAPEKSAASSMTTLLLLAINFGSLANFIPFVELDGYFMLSHTLNMVELRQDSHRLWLNGLKKALFGKRAEVLQYARRGRTVYRIYGFCSLIYTLLFTGYMVFFYFAYISTWIGQAAATIILPLALLLMVLFSKPVRNWIMQRWFAGARSESASSH